MKCLIFNPQLPRVGERFEPSNVQHSIVQFQYYLTINYVTTLFKAVMYQVVTQLCVVTSFVGYPNSICTNPR